MCKCFIQEGFSGDPGESEGAEQGRGGSGARVWPALKVSYTSVFSHLELGYSAPSLNSNWLMVAPW